MKRLALLAALLCLAPVAAQDAPSKLAVTGGGVKSVIVVESVPFTISAPAGAAFYFWTLPAGVTADDKGDKLEVKEAPSGVSLSFAVKYVTADWESKKFVTAFDKVSVYAGAITPGPGPGPQPPGPGPQPQPSTDPIGAGGFAVLMSFDSSNTTRPPAELSVIAPSKAIRAYLESKCVADPTTPNWKAYRVYPANTTGAPKLWDDAFKRKGGADWILIGTGSGGYSGPLPKTEAECLALLRKYGGN